MTPLFFILQECCEYPRRFSYSTTAFTTRAAALKFSESLFAKVNPNDFVHKFHIIEKFYQLPVSLFLVCNINENTIDIFTSKTEAEAVYSLSPNNLYIHPITILDD
jgi:hypothetical protein